MQLPDFSDLHILVVGDIMIDRYLRGSINRISPEAPVSVVHCTEKEDRLGGAANVCRNIAALGAKVSLLSISGQDDGAKAIKELLGAQQNIQFHLVECNKRSTTIKTRVLARNQHIIRIDEEDLDDIKRDEEEEVLTRLDSILDTKTIAGVILQDYNKGMLTLQVIQAIIKKCNDRKIPTFVDPKEKNFFAYTNCTVFKPNEKELHSAFNNSKETIEEMCFQLHERLETKEIYTTLGSKGIYIYNGSESEIVPTVVRNVSDVCGAGDAVISIISLCHCKGLDQKTIARIANIGGGQVCETAGVSIVDLDSIQKELTHL